MPSMPIIGAGIGLEVWTTTSKEDFRVAKICVTASFADLEVSVKTGVPQDELELAAPTARGLLLRVSRPAAPDMFLTQSNSILRYIAEMRPAHMLYGHTDFESAMVDQWLDMCWHEFEVPMLAVAQASGNATVMAEVKKHLLSFLRVADSILAEKTLLASERVTIADISLACAAQTILGGGVNILGPKDYEAIPHVMRWYRTVIHQEAFLRSVGEEPKGVQDGKGGNSTPGTGKGASLSALPSTSGGGTEGSGASLPTSPYPPISLGMTSPAVVHEEKPLKLEKDRFRRGRVRVRELLGAGAGAVGQNTKVMGWLRTMRKGNKGALLFLVVNDGSCAASLQVVAEQGVTRGFEGMGKCGGVGASVSVVGSVVASPAKGQEIELKAQEVEVLGAVLEPDGYPLAKKAHSLEFLRSVAHLRARSKVHSAVMRVRHAMAYATHRFFNTRGFLYVHTPIVTGADCEGAGEQFLVTTLLPEEEEGPGHGGGGGGGGGGAPPLPLTKEGKVDYARDFFARRTCLTVSGQLNVETHACALGDVYTFGPTFRAENSHTSRHLAEFWMIEPEVAFTDLTGDMDLAEDFLKYLVAYALEHCQEDLEFFETFPGGEPGLRDRLKNVLHNEFVRMTYTELVDLVRRDAAAKKVEFSVIPEWGDDLGSEHERYVAERVYNSPCIVTDYPKEIKAFYMKVNQDGRTVAAMDILVPKIGEIIGGSQREEDLGVLTARAREMGLPLESIDWYLDLRKYGSIQHAGFGLGFERLVMFTTGIENIRDVIPFPRYPGHSEF